MRAETARVTFLPGGEAASVPVGVTVLEAARIAGVEIYATCGGKGTCGKCIVRIEEGAPGPTRPAVRPVRIPPGWHLACLVEVAGPLTVRPRYIVRAHG